MTEMTIHQPQTQALAVSDGGTELIMRAVQQMAAAGELGDALARTTFVPAHFRGKPDDVAAAIMYGAAIGLDPMTALRSIYVVGGNPGLYARQMAAVVIAKGHSVRTVEVTDTSATVTGQRRDSDDVETVTWTIERATRAGYVPTINPDTGKYRTNANGKVIGNEKYLTDPQAMLYARALGDVCRRIAPDALAGLDYSVEELHVIDHVDVTPERPKRESAAALLGAPKPEPDVVVSTPAMPAPVTTTTTPATEPEPGSVPMVTSQQLKKIGATMRDLGITEKAHALGYIEQALGLKIASRSELTKEEAGRLIDALEEDLAKQEQDTQEAAEDDGDQAFPGGGAA